MPGDPLSEAAVYRAFTGPPVKKGTLVLGRISIGHMRKTTARVTREANPV
jgi:hypothetical protein